MTVYRCDRCNSIFDKLKRYDFLAISNVTMLGEYRKDLCPECQSTLEKWFKNSEGERMEEEEV